MFHFSMGRMVLATAFSFAGLFLLSGCHDDECGCDREVRKTTYVDSSGSTVTYRSSSSAEQGQPVSYDRRTNGDVSRSNSDRTADRGTGERKYDRPADATVEMTADDMLRPAHITVKSGQTVEWSNNSNKEHSVTDNADLVNNRDNISLPSGAQAFDSGKIRPGETFRYTFTTPGTYKYVCTLHQDRKEEMGTIDVEKADSNK